jgi:long-chain acyl-CoA synthetase
MSERVDFRPFESELKDRAQTWTQSAVFARENPNGIAIYSDVGLRSFAELESNANRIANALRSEGLKAGDAIALMCRNRPEFLEVLLACMRIGLRLTPVNTHLTAGEVSYIVENCEAKLFLVEAELLDEMQKAAKLNLRVPIVATGDQGDVADSASVKRFSKWVRHASMEQPGALSCGTLMLYTSGTTGRPKGVFRDLPETVLPQYAGTFVEYDTRTDTALCCGPAYHSASLLFDLRWPLASGVPIVLMQKFDAVRALELIERHGVTHTHMVATMFQRLLALTPDQRQKYDLHSLRIVVHGAAPCPVPVKRSMIDWLGPILIEYYGATEGGDGINIKSEEWLKRPGAVGKLEPARGHMILNDAGQECAVGEIGKIYFKAPSVGRFVYFGDPAKTADAYAGDRFTLGDMGYIDAERYLFLTGRIAECIISGGVNIYPQEIDDVLMTHPAVEDVCTVGAPDDVWGEKVVAVVVLRAGNVVSDAMRTVLADFASSKLAGFKRPKQYVFETALPRSASGKLLRQQVRQRFWVDRNRSI